MRKKFILLIGIIAGIITACEDLKFGNNFLEKPNSDDVSIDTVFSSKKYADQALNQFYKSLWDFMPSLRGCHPEGMILDVYTDIGYSSMCAWNHGAITASSGVYCFPTSITNSEICGDFADGIRRSYIYIENVDRVPDMTEDEKKIRKAEAKVVIANHYAQMIRFYGGLPWIDHAFKPDELFDMPRLTLEETVNRTVTLLDEASKDLPWFTTSEEYGHMTAAAAKALKVRLLHFVASPLFNSDKPYFDGDAAKEYLVWYGDYQESRWQAALDAAKEFIRLNNENGNYYEIINTGNPREDYVNGYFVKGSREVIMPTFRWGTYDGVDKPFRMYESGYGSPRSSYADMFQWNDDGSDFNWDNPVHAKNPFFDENKQPTRDIRLYENLVVNGDKWQDGRTAEVYDGGREGNGTGSIVQKKTQFGYGFRKFIRNKKDEIKGKPYMCSFVRMPEIYLCMAEAMNQLGIATIPDEFGNTAYSYLNKVHERAGLPPVTSSEVHEGEELLDYLLDERAREFGQEDFRYFDMIRHKKGAEWATRPVEILTAKNINHNDKVNGFSYEVSIRDDIKYLWNEHWYLLPFPVAEINKKYGLIQNPGWE